MAKAPPRFCQCDAGRFLDFAALGLSGRSRGGLVLTPTVAGTEKQRETHEKDENAHVALKDTQAIIVGDDPVHLDSLIPQAGAHVRRDKHSHEPMPFSSVGNPDVSFFSGSAQLHQWIAKGNGKKETSEGNLHRRRQLSPHGGQAGNERQTVSGYTILLALTLE